MQDQYTDVRNNLVRGCNLFEFNLNVASVSKINFCIFIYDIVDGLNIVTSSSSFIDSTSRNVKFL